MHVKILIIKLGYSETLNSEVGKNVSLGDVLRTTSILSALKEKYPESHISWLVSEQADPLLHNNHLIDRVLVWDSFVPFQLMKENYDVLLNLEKVPGICALTDMIAAWVKYGFRFDPFSGTYHAYERGQDFIEYINSKKSDVPKSCWQQMLIEMLGIEWKNQEYILDYIPKGAETFDIGFNFEVGVKWPTKGMPVEHWKELEKKLLTKGYAVTWQQGQKNLFDYMEWINSCRIVITSDSLGMHIGFAFHKKVICLFGPTDPKEVFFYTGARLLHSPIPCPEMPCLVPKCKTGLNCLSHVDLDDIVRTVQEIS
jgi:heptosyltransferase II